MSKSHGKADAGHGSHKASAERTHKVSTKVYEAELYRLQTELVKVQNWAKATGARIVILFEGR
ncbi:MAG: hypothetical protein KDB50_17355, partial [Mycobacterium sp.]|nr:hypothetical protein [Mycobacterium sp.]